MTENDSTGWYFISGNFDMDRIRTLGACMEEEFEDIQNPFSNLPEGWSGEHFFFKKNRNKTYENLVVVFVF